VSDNDGLLGRLKSGLSKTRDRLSLRVKEALVGRTTIDDDLYEELEAAMLEADLGVGITERVLEAIAERVRNERIESPERVQGLVREEARALLDHSARAEPVQVTDGPMVSLVVGVNGVGKTTTIGKLARWHAARGKRVLVCAGDTFRAAAIEQLTTWAERTGARIVHHREGADPAAVVFDAIEAAIAGRFDVVLIDTAGRLHTKDNLMTELEKVRRVVEKRIPGGPHETLLILDATTGQNALSQAREFTRRVGVTGLIVTKLDGTARGGVVAAIVAELDVPVLFVGTGETQDDLLEFDPATYADALFA